MWIRRSSARLALALTALAGSPLVDRGWAALPDGFTRTTVASSLSLPTALAFLPDGRMLVTTKAGQLVRVDAGIRTTLGNIQVCSGSEMGLLGIAVDPAFASNGRVYLYRTRPGAGGCGTSTGRVNEVIRVTISGDTIADGSTLVLVTGIPTDLGNHDGGGLRIGPDGHLYVGAGDSGLGDNQGGPGSSTNPYAQDLGSLAGKVLRIALDGSVPADNPFVGVPGARPEVWAYGFRNPFRFSFDPEGGRLWLGDVGDFTWEEIDVVPRGGNHSWPACEGLAPAGCAGPGDVVPVLVYPHSGASSYGSSVTGGDFGGAAMGPFSGHYFFGDFVSGKIWRAVPNVARDGLAGSPVVFDDGASGPVDIVRGPDGSLYYVAIGAGEVRRISSTAEPARVDGYSCYKAMRPAGAPALGTDVFEVADDLATAEVTAKRVLGLCLPASIDGQPVLRADVAQEDVLPRLVPGTPRLESTLFLLSDRFGGRDVVAFKRDGLLLPSAWAAGSSVPGPLSGDPIDGYSCHRVKPAPGSNTSPPSPSPLVVDALFPSGQAFSLGKPTRICLPASFEGSTPVEPEDVLLCYAARLPSGSPRFARTPVGVLASLPPGLLDGEVLSVNSLRELCVPARAS